MTMTKRLAALLLALAMILALTACGNTNDATSSVEAPASSVAATSQAHLTVQVKFADGTTKDFPIDTDAEFLRGALESIDLVEGDESEYGLYVKKVDGVEAAEGAYWAFYKDGEYLMTGVDTTPIADGDHFEIVHEEISY